MISYEIYPEERESKYTKRWTHAASGAWGLYKTWCSKDMITLHIPEGSPVFPVVLFVSTWVKPEDAADRIVKLRTRIKAMDRTPLVLVYASATENIFRKLGDDSDVFGLPHPFTVASVNLDAKLDVPTRLLIADGSPSSFLRKPANFVRKYLREAKAKKYPLVRPFSDNWYQNQKGGYTTLRRGSTGGGSTGHKTGIAYPEGWFD